MFGQIYGNSSQNISGFKENLAMQMTFAFL